MALLPAFTVVVLGIALGYLLSARRSPPLPSHGRSPQLAHTDTPLSCDANDYVTIDRGEHLIDACGLMVIHLDKAQADGIGVVSLGLNDSECDNLLIRIPYLAAG